MPSILKTKARRVLRYFNKHGFDNTNLTIYMVDENSTLDDIVVPQSVLRDNFSNIENAHLVNLQSGKHALGYVHPNDVFTHIMDYVDA